MGPCRAMGFGEIINIRNMWAVGKIIKLTVMGYMLLRKVIIKVFDLLFRVIRKLCKAWLRNRKFSQR